MFPRLEYFCKVISLTLFPYCNNPVVSIGDSHYWIFRGLSQKINLDIGATKEGKLKPVSVLCN